VFHLARTCALMQDMRDHVCGAPLWKSFKNISHEFPFCVHSWSWGYGYTVSDGLRLRNACMVSARIKLRWPD